MTVASRLRFKPFPYRGNSLNLFRLVFAAMVLFAHSWFTAGAGASPGFRGENLGGWAVAGFFVVSGFLITGSRFSHSAGAFLVHRIARIFPAFIVCLVLTAFVFAPIADLWEHGTLRGFLSTGPTPLNFVWSNLALHINNYDIGHTLDTVPYPGAWNGSMWTLFYEFCCYMIIWILGGLLIVRRSVLPMVVLFVASVANWALLPAVIHHFGLNEDYQLLSHLLPYFLGGALVYYAVQRVGVSAVLGMACVLVTAGLIVFVPGWGGQASAPFMAYGLIWLSTLIPQPRLIAKNDISYGVYIYAWPMQQLFAMWGAAQLGMWFYWLTTAAATVFLASLSWVFIEHPILRLVKRAPVAIPAPATAPAVPQHEPAAT